MRGHIGKAVRRDLADIGAYIAERDPEAAGRLTDDLLDRAEAIGELPFGYAVLRTWRGHELRKRTYKHYAIVYYVARNTVNVLRIVHTARDFSRLLN